MELVCLVWLHVLGSCVKIHPFSSPGAAEARKVELFILCLYPSHLNWSHFPSSPRASEKEGERRMGISGNQGTKNLANNNKKKSLINRNVCYCLGLPLNTVQSWCR